MGKMTFCERVLEQMTRATGGEREAIRAELEGHLTDHRDALTEKGMDPEQAMREAEEAMGDPAEIGKALNAQLSPFWLWAGRVALGAVGLILWCALWFSAQSNASRLWPPLTGPWEALKCAWENWQVRQGDAWELVLEDRPVSHDVTYSFQCWEVMRVREELVCLVRVDLAPIYGYPGYYRGDFYFCTYNEDPFTPAIGNFLECLTITPENQIMADLEKELSAGLFLGRIFYIRGDEGFQIGTCSGLMQEGDTYVDVTYDYLGTYATMRCPIVWESGDREVAP